MAEQGGSGGSSPQASTEQGGSGGSSPQASAEQGGSGGSSPQASAERITYSSYLRLDQLLAAQEPRSGEHDEMLFIVIHQIYELWFKQLLHEFGRVQSLLESGGTTHAMRTLRRTLAILKIVVEQLDVLETMTPTQFTAFRAALGTSSGFQSAQFRELEAVLGRRDPMMVAQYAEGSAERERIQAAMSRPSLFDSFVRYLADQGYDVPAEVRNRDFSQPIEASAGMQQVLKKVYDDDTDATAVSELLVDLDEGMQEWRYHHVKMVERTIGGMPGTGGSAGAAYLSSTLGKPTFPDLWAMRSLG
jgi:tryptophan 2,3-dioxygenase